MQTNHPLVVSSLGLTISPYAASTHCQSTGLPDIQTPMSQVLLPMQGRFHPPQTLSHLHRLPPLYTPGPLPQQQPGSPPQSVPTSPTACYSACAPSSSLFHYSPTQLGRVGSLTGCHTVKHFYSIYAKVVFPTGTRLEF